MRFTMLAALALVAGCDWELPSYTGGGWDGGTTWGGQDTTPFLRGEPADFSQESTLWADTQGLALNESGLVGGAAMNGTTCQISVDNGWVGADVDADWNDDEVIVDSEEDGGAVIGLAVTNGGFHVIQYDDWNSGVVSSIDHPVLDVRFADSGFVALADNGGSCAVQFINARGDVVASTAAAGACQPGFAVAGDDAIVNTSIGLNKVTAGSSEVIGDAADLVAFDTSIDMIYTANAGEALLNGLDRSGAVQWTADLGASIVDIEAVPARSAVFVSVENDDLSGAIVLIDGLTGEQITIAQTLAAARDLEVSGDGDTLAAAVPSQVHYLRVR